MVSHQYSLLDQRRKNHVRNPDYTNHVVEYYLLKGCYWISLLVLSGKFILRICIFGVQFLIPRHDTGPIQFSYFR